MVLKIGCIVEGHGETTALPVLLRRLFVAIDPTVNLEIPDPLRTPYSKLV